MHWSPRITPLQGCEWQDCRFNECDFQSLTINEQTRLAGCKFDEKSDVIGLLKSQDSDASMRVFVPEACEEMLTECGAIFEHPAEAPLKLDLRPIPSDVRGALTRFRERLRT